jgi:hypothetical protein
MCLYIYITFEVMQCDVVVYVYQYTYIYIYIFDFCRLIEHLYTGGLPTTSI